jgi:hypothetical protein
MNQWETRVQPLNQWEIMGAPKNLIDISFINVISQIFFHLYLGGNGNDDISSEEHFENLKSVEVLIFT